MDVREKLMEMSEQLRYCAIVSDCPNCKRWEKVCENQCVDNLLLMAADLIDEVSHGVTVQEWTSASEPPKDTYEYWIAYKAGGDYSYSTGYFDGKCWRSAITHKQIPVTHWQPMPKPPKGE